MLSLVVTLQRLSLFANCLTKLYLPASLTSLTFKCFTLILQNIGQQLTIFANKRLGLLTPSPQPRMNLAAGVGAVGEPGREHARGAAGPEVPVEGRRSAGERVEPEEAVQDAADVVPLPNLQACK